MIKEPNSIILADDDPDDCQIFKEVLDAMHYGSKLITFTDGAKLVKHVSNNSKPENHYIFLDINMPKMDGIECLRYVRSRISYNSVAVVMLSTTSVTSTIEQCYYLGASRYIIKPMTFPKLSEYIARILKMDYEELLAPISNNFLLV